MPPSSSASASTCSTSKSSSRTSRIASCFSRSSFRPGQQPVGGEDRQAGVAQRAEEHQHVVGARPRRRPPRRTRARSRSGGGRRRSGARRRPARPGARRSPPGRRSARACRRSVVANGSPAVARSSCSCAAPSGSGKRLKMGERLARVARVRRSRSSFGPGCVRSCGRIRPAPYSSTRTRAKKPVRLRRSPSGPVKSCRSAHRAGSRSLRQDALLAPGLHRGLGVEVVVLARRGRAAGRARPR